MTGASRAVNPRNWESMSSVFEREKKLIRYEHKDWTIVEPWGNYVCDSSGVSKTWYYQKVDNCLHECYSLNNKGILSSTSHIAYNTPHTSFAVLTFSFRVSQDTKKHVNSCVRDFSWSGLVVWTRWFLHITTDLNWFFKCVLEDVNLCFSLWGQVTSFVWVL